MSRCSRAAQERKPTTLRPNESCSRQKRPAHHCMTERRTEREGKTIKGKNKPNQWRQGNCAPIESPVLGGSFLQVIVLGQKEE